MRKIFNVAAFAQDTRDLTHGRIGAALVLAASEDEARGVAFRHLHEEVPPEHYLAPQVFMDELTDEIIATVLTEVSLDLLTAEIANRINGEVEAAVQRVVEDQAGA